ncbi:MAG: biotin/lipoyl-binding protein [Bacteroidales bacterium]|nr:biotin/lipoyl-binding protein [Bacteroidales bacterium]
MTKKNDYKIEIRSDEVNDILSRPPRWIIRWGIGVIFLVVLIIIIGSSFFKYPDIITAPITVTSEILPANIISKVSGRINNLLVKDGDSVEANNIVAIIESPTEYSSYKALKDLCDGFSNVITRDKIIFNYTFPANLKLGNIQAAYTQFLKSYNDYKSFMEANYHEKKILIIKNQIEQQRLMLNLCEQQMKISSEQYSLSKKSYKRDSLLFSQGVVAQTDIEQSRTRFLATKQQLESSKSSIVNMRLSLLKAEQSVFELNQ